MDKYIISGSGSGLSNRLNCLISSMKISKISSRELILYWPKNRLCSCNFSDLFDNNISQITRPELIRLINSDKKDIFFIDRNVPVLHNLKSIREKYIKLSTWRIVALNHEFNKKRLIFNNKYFHNTVKQIYRLEPIKYIIEEVDRFSDNFDESTISFSIRSWIECKNNTKQNMLLSKLKENLKKYPYGKQMAKRFDMENVYETIDKYKDSNFFVSCDSPDIIRKLIKRYGKRILYYPKRTYQGDRFSKKGVQDILIDLFLLSKNKRLITSKGSTYSQLAWWFGGCKAEIEDYDS